MICAKVKLIWLAVWTGARGGLVSTPDVFSWFSELEENVLYESCAQWNNTHLDLIQLLLLGPKKWIYLTFVWIKICNCWFSGQSLSSSEDDDIAWKQKPKENQKRKKKGKNIIDSGNVLGWTWTVSKGTDVETLHKLLHLCFCFNGVLCCTVSLSVPNAICFFTKTWCKKIHIMTCTTSQWCPDPSSKLILHLC